MNTATRNLSRLEARNYVRKADPAANYWFDFAARQMAAKRVASGGNFFLIIHGSPESEDDFFVIPYDVVRHVLTDENLVEAKEGDRRVRWIGNIRDRRMHVTRAGAEVDLTDYYGNMAILAAAAGGSLEQVYPESDEGDGPAPIDTSAFVPVGGDLRVVALRQIKARRGQQAFREMLRARYGDRCMISGCHLMDVVEAVHIKPYRGPQDHHAENGLLLRADLHTLFDLDLLGIEPDTLTVRLHTAVQAAGYAALEGATLNVGDAGPSKETLGIRWKAFCRRAGG